MLIISDPPEGKEGQPKSPPDYVPDEGEMSLLKAKHFKTADVVNDAIWKLIFVADASDLQKLEQIYPSHIAAYTNYKNVPGWFEDLITRIPHRRASDTP